MNLSQSLKKQYRAIGHGLKPVVTVAAKGVTSAVIAETQRALHDHELIKVKFQVGDREVKRDLIENLCNETGATLVQTIGNIALIFRKAKEPNPQLSNLMR